MALDTEKGRPTKDIDFLAKAFVPDENTLLEILTKVIKIESDDGVTFDLDSLSVEDIKVDDDYKGLRVKFFAFLGNARERMQLDIGVGDEIVPRPANLSYPMLLEEETFDIVAYSLETVIAEKLEAMITLSYLNSRMKDFYDIALIASTQNFDGKILQEAIQATFKKRGITLEDGIEIFSDDFKNNESKQIQWAAFLRKSDLSEAPEQFNKIVQRVEGFLSIVLKAIISKKKFTQVWNANTNKWVDCK